MTTCHVVRNDDAPNADLARGSLVFARCTIWGANLCGAWTVSCADGEGALCRSIHNQCRWLKQQCRPAQDSSYARRRSRQIFSLQHFTSALLVTAISARTPGGPHRFHSRSSAFRFSLAHVGGGPYGQEGSSSVFDLASGHVSQKTDRDEK